MNAFVDFMNRPLGRLARIALGVALIIVGVTVVGGAAGWVVAAVGVVPIAMGVSARCLVEFLPGGRTAH